MINNKLNLFLLDDPLEDITCKKLIRVKITKNLLKVINSVLQQMPSSNPIEILGKKLRPSYRCKTIKEWLKEGNFIPIRALSVLASFYSNNNSEVIIQSILRNMKYLRSSTSSKITYLPTSLSDDLLYIVGVIIGDGSLPWRVSKGKRTYPIYICGTNKLFICNTVSRLMKNIFGIEFAPNGRDRIGKKPLFEWYVSCKPLQRFLNKLFDIPIGKKSHIVRMPEIVRKLSAKERIPFIAGIIDTDWGKWGNKFGIGTASKLLVKDISKTLLQLNNSLNMNMDEVLIKDKFKAYTLYLQGKDLKFLYELLCNNYRLKNKEKSEIIERLLPP
jgi:hypothetical protein